MCKLKADANVLLAIDSQLSRESEWSRKSSTIVQCQEVLNKVQENNSFPTPQNCQNFESSLAHQIPKLKKAVKDTIKEQFSEKYNQQAEALSFQGEFLTLLNEENSDVTWRSYIFGVPRGVMSFAMRSSTNILATPDDLKLWKKTRSDNCVMCKEENRVPSKCTLMHLLNNCTAFLETKYVWRHDSVIYFILETLKQNKPDNLEIYGDVEGHKCNGGTIPVNIVVTGQRPDIVIIDNTTKTVWLWELSVSFETNIEQAHTRKKVKYTQLESDIEDAGFSCRNIPFEVGSRGHLTLDNRSNLTILHSLTRPKMKLKTFLQIISKISLLCSYSIYVTRNDRGWTDPPPLRPYK